MNKKSLIFNSIVAGLSVLFLAFLALPYASSLYGGLAGYDFFALLQYSGAEGVLMGLLIIFDLLLAITLLVFSVLGILSSANVIKSEKFGKVLKVLNLVFAIVLTVFAVLTLAMVLVMVVLPSEGDFTIGIGAILNTLFAIGALVLVCLNRKK